MTLLKSLKTSSDYLTPENLEKSALTFLPTSLSTEPSEKDPLFFADDFLSEEELLLNSGYDTSTSLNLVTEGTVSRTTAGGRRRRFSVEAIRTTVGPYTSFAVSQRSKSVERFLAIEKLSFVPSFFSLSETFDTREVCTPSSGFKPYKCVFLQTRDYTKIPGTPVEIKSRSTSTQVFSPKTGFDVSAEPVQYRVLKSLNFRAFFLKNRGAKHPRARALNLLSVLSLYIPRSVISRRYGRKLE